MKNEGISSAIIQGFIGNESKVIRDLFTHIKFEALGHAIKALPYFC